MSDAPTAARRPLARSIALGVVMGMLLGAAVLGAVALPLFFFAEAVEPGRGVDRPLVRNGLLGVAVPAGVLGAVVGGACVGRWYRRGGTLPREETGPPGG